MKEERVQPDVASIITQTEFLIAISIELLRQTSDCDVWNYCPGRKPRTPRTWSQKPAPQLRARARHAWSTSLVSGGSGERQAYAGALGRSASVWQPGALPASLAYTASPGEGFGAGLRLAVEERRRLSLCESSSRNCRPRRPVHWQKLLPALS